MLKPSILIPLFFAAALSARAQFAHRVKPIEFEVRFGATMPVNSLRGSDKTTAPAFGLELRYNFPDVPLDAGFALDINAAAYSFGYIADDFEQRNRTCFVGLTGDYNFRQGGTINPFVGLGFGIGVHDAIMDVVDDTKDGINTLAFVPRLGVELWRHLRVTFAATLSTKYYNNFSINVGYAIGGGRKRR